jgi:flagellar export protein FliJ
MLAAQRYQAALQAERQMLAQQNDLLNREIERRRAALQEAEQQVRMLEKLSERKQQAARAEASKLEAKRLDELACLRFQPSGH